MKPKLSLVFASAVGFCFIAHAQYSFTDLGPPLPGFANSIPLSVNNRGEVVGVCYNDFFLTQGFLYTNGVTQALSLPGHNSSWPRRIDDFGNIIGTAAITVFENGFYLNNGSTVAHWDRDQPGTQYDPAAWPAGHYKNSFDYAFASEANNINQAVGTTILNQAWDDFWSNGNQIVYAGNLDQRVPAFWDNGIMTILAPADLQPWDIFDGSAVSINDNGTIVGTMTLYNFIESRRTSFTFISQSGGPPEPMPGPFFYPLKINNAGDILCLSPEPDYLPSIYRNGTFIPLGSLDAGGGPLNARDINTQGQVVGDALNTVTGLYTAFLWQLDPVSGLPSITDLNALAAPEGWHLNAANHITDSGIIVGSGTFQGFERSFMLTPALVNVDANRDGQITFDGKDSTSPLTRFRFWLNDNVDLDDTSANPANNQPDHTHASIQNERDLEDFTRLHVKAPSAFVNDGTWKVAFAFSEVVEGTPGVNLWRAPTSDTRYLTDRFIAARVIRQPSAKLCSVNGTEVVLNQSQLDLFDNPDKLGAILFEGSAAGKGALTVRFYRNDVKVTEGKVYLDLNPIARMYEHWTVGDHADPTLDPDNIPLAASLTSDSQAYGDSSPEERDYILFVHGWRLLPWERRAVANTSYKRLWHLGYKGRFGLFSWPTEWKSGIVWSSLTADRRNYHNSEYKAWYSAAGLETLLAQKNQQYPGRVMLMAHCMGNVAASEAMLRNAHPASGASAPLVRAYVASQASSVAHCYNPNLSNALPGSSQMVNWYKSYPIEDQMHPTAGTEYFRGINASSQKYVNFYNPSDFTLSRLLWGSSQTSKPDQNYRYSRGRFFHYGEPLRPPERTFDVFAFACPARSGALGTQPNVGGPFAEQLDLNGSFAFGGSFNSHNSQFLSNFRTRSPYWEALLLKFGYPGSNVN